MSGAVVAPLLASPVVPTKSVAPLNLKGSNPFEEDPLARSQIPPPSAPQSPVPGLSRLNDAAPGAAEEALLACCGSRRWAIRMTAHRPYPDVDSLLAAASEASYDMSHRDLSEALADESCMPQPLLGMRAPGSAAAHTALRAAHAAYEARFGHVFVVCLDECPPEEMLDTVLASIRARLGSDPDEERSTTAEQLRRITLSRLTHLVSSHASASS